MFDYNVLPNKNLKITASNAGRSELARKYDSGRAPIYIESDVFEWIGLDQIQPEWIAALTGGPIIGDGVTWADDADMPMVEGNVWWFANYMIIDPMKELKNKGYVVFQHANNG